MTDPIADMLTRIRNSVTAKHTRVDMPASRIKADIAKILQDEGYIQGFKLLEDQANPVKGNAPVKTLRLFLKYGPHGENPDAASTSAATTSRKYSPDSAPPS